METEPLTPRFEKINSRHVPITEAEIIGMTLMRVTPYFIPVDAGVGAMPEQIGQADKQPGQDARYPRLNEYFRRRCV
jgi:hypothetical protein